MYHIAGYPSIKIFTLVGNDTIHRYPLSYRGKLIKLLCISKELFEKLALAAQEFFVKENVLKTAPARAQKTKSLRKTPITSLRNIRHSEYAPTSIWHTRYDEFWQWQRVSEWWREFDPDGCQQISHEKRHILL